MDDDMDDDDKDTGDVDGDADDTIDGEEDDGFVLCKGDEEGRCVVAVVEEDGDSAEGSVDTLFS